MFLSKKFLFASALISSFLAQSVFGWEKDGVFLGVEFGASKVKFEQKYDYKEQNTLHKNEIKANNTLPSLALKGGYKWFFGEQRNFGLRTYAQVGMGWGKLKNAEYDIKGAHNTLINQTGKDSVFLGKDKAYYTNFMDCFVGADILYNFAQINNTVFGLYLGAGIGVLKWDSNGRKYEPEEGKKYEPENGKKTYTNLATNANFGLRVNIDERHEFDLGARAYSTNSKIFEVSNSPWDMIGNNLNMEHIETNHYRPFTVFLSYVYNF